MYTTFWTSSRGRRTFCPRAHAAAWIRHQTTMLCVSILMSGVLCALRRHAWPALPRRPNRAALLLRLRLDRLLRVPAAGSNTTVHGAENLSVHPPSPSVRRTGSRRHRHNAHSRTKSRSTSQRVSAHVRRARRASPSSSLRQATESTHRPWRPTCSTGTRTCAGWTSRGSSRRRTFWKRLWFCLWYCHSVSRASAGPGAAYSSLGHRVQARLCSQRPWPQSPR